MFWLGHLGTTWGYFGRLNLEDAFWAVAPDIPMALFLSPRTEPWGVIKNQKAYTWFYRLPHSLWFLFLIRNSRARKIYAFHILMDILSHTGQWSIEPLFPMGPAIHGIWDAGEWV
jgi:hypothetical protein